MTIERSRSTPKRARVRRLHLAGTVLVFACSSNDALTPSSPPPPVIGAIFPSAAVAGSPDLTLTITGSNFVDSGRPEGSHAAWVAGSDSTLLATTYVGSGQLTVVIPAALLSKSVTAQVLLETGDVMGDLPLIRSNAVEFAVTDGTDVSRTGAIVVYGRTTTLPPKMKGARNVSLDGSPQSRLTEGQSVTYSPVALGAHRLVLSNPCGSSHTPTTMKLTVSGGQTVSVTVDIPANCE